MTAPHRLTRLRLAGAGFVSAFALAACGGGEPEGAGEVNVFTARHYASDDAVYQAFEAQTGVTVNVIEASGDLLIERVRADGERSQADVVITVDAGRLHRAEAAGLFQPAGELDGALSRVPETLRHPDGQWFGFATRARGIAYAVDRVDPADIQSYDALADEAFRGRVCVRSSNNVYNQSILAAYIAQAGTEAAEAWADGVVRNLARPPQGGDTDQIRAVAAGECDVALVNHYYLARLERAEDGADRAAADAVDFVFPALPDGGTHVNVSGAGLAAGAPNRENAEAFLAFLLSDEAQRAFAELTNEFPAVETVDYENPILRDWEGFEADDVNVAELGENGAEAQRIFDRVGWP